MIWTRQLLPAGAVAVIGSHSSQMPKIMIRTMPVTNSGTVASDSPVTVITRSAGRLTCSAANDAADDAERHDDHERDRRELERVDERVADELGDGSLEHVRRAHVALHEAAEPVPVRLEERVVVAELLVQRDDAGVVGERPEDRAAGIAGSTCAATKTITLRSQSVMSARPRRRRTKRVTCGDGPGAPGQRELAGAPGCP